MSRQLLVATAIAGTIAIFFTVVMLLRIATNSPDSPPAAHPATTQGDSAPSEPSPTRPTSPKPMDYAVAIAENEVAWASAALALEDTPALREYLRATEWRVQVARDAGGVPAVDPLSAPPTFSGNASVVAVLSGRANVSILGYEVIRGDAQEARDADTVRIVESILSNARDSRDKLAASEKPEATFTLPPATPYAEQSQAATSGGNSTTPTPVAPISVPGDPGAGYPVLP